MPVDIFAPKYVAGVVHFQPLEERFHAGGQDVLRDAVQAAEIFDHLPAGHAVVDRRVGRHEADLAANLGGLGQHVVAVDGGRAAGGTQHRAEDPQGRGLAGPVGTQQAINLAGPGVKADAAQGHELRRAADRNSAWSVRGRES